MMKISVYVTDEQLPYLQSSARLRQITPTNMVRKCVTAMLNNQLIRATVDDDEELVKLWGNLEMSPAQRARARRRRQRAARALLEGAQQ